MTRVNRTAALISALWLAVSPSWGASQQATFGTPEEAVQAIISACKKNDAKTLLEIFGPDGKDIVESGDRREDNTARAKFVAFTQESHRLIQDPANPDRVVLAIGEEDWPFPVPIVRKNSRWVFDSAEGRQEILARRIGSNEMTAVEVCRGYVAAQLEYAQTHRQKNGLPVYAKQIISAPGKQDGLYWEPKKGGEQPNIPKGFAKAAAGMSQNEREPYHGYYFKVLMSQGANAHGGAVNYLVNNELLGGFALVAWPAQYGVSGIQTFIINHDDNVYEKTLGPDTAKIAEQITTYDPDPTWRPVQSE
jgi:hypothetical protein